MADSGIRVVVCGATGRMGSETVRAVTESGQFTLSGVVVRRPDAYIGTVPAFASLKQALESVRPQCIVDFTNAEVALTFGLAALGQNIPFVTGTTGLTPNQVRQLNDASAARQVGCVVAPNFAIGAVLAMHFAATAARFFSWAEIIELHHERKADAPSGTALSTARAMVAARGQPFDQTGVMKQTLPGTRGGETGGVHLHSVRLPGLVAHQEVLLGGPGEVLTIRHDSLQRSSFMPGVLLAIRWALEHGEFVNGLGPVLGL
ncbi:MAG: 4-hydroxy-tetrahydrodipicolinate reductase [Chloroflexi bacterium]|nr:4-hydroxy-tetrahydrodipicolinate reductase [Chloroflexota bacterium]